MSELVCIPSLLLDQIQLLLLYVVVNHCFCSILHFLLSY